jgi:integrase
MERGRPLDPAYVTRLFQVIRTQDEPLRELTFHGLRHSAASLMLAGVPTSRRYRSCWSTPRFRSLPTCAPTSSRPSVSRP